MGKHGRSTSDNEDSARPSRRVRELGPEELSHLPPTRLGSGEIVLSRRVLEKPRNLVIKDATFVGLNPGPDASPRPFIETFEGKKIRKALIKNVELAPLPEKCLPGTRVTILNEVNAKIVDSGHTNIIWIKGFPGVGKSTLASTIISLLQERGQLLSYFAFDRARPTLTTTRKLWQRVAWDFARLLPPTRKALLRCIDDEPVGINIPGITAFFRALIEEPLSHLPGDMLGPDRPVLVIVIDAVDECGGLDGPRSKDRKDLLATLEQWHSKLPRNIKLVLTSREEDDLKRRLFPISCPIDFSITTVDEDFHDISDYLMTRLGGIAGSYSAPLPNNWVNEAINYLAKRAEGVFVWATTAANYIECGEPQSQLENIRSGLGLGGEGGSLFSLYRVLLKTSFKDMRDKQREAFKSVTGAMMFAQRPFYDIEFIAISPIVSMTMLQYIRIGLRSVVVQGGNLRFSHPSFIDFLLSPECPDDFAINQSERQGQLAVLCLTTMSTHLRFNICNLETSYLMNTNIPDIEARVKNGISSLLSYSCCFIADHLSHTTFTKRIIGQIRVVFKEKLLFWLEAMSLLKEINQTVAILRMILNWTVDKDREITEFLLDALRFIQAFSAPISLSAPHIYLSALPFSPKQSLVAKHFLPKFPRSIALTTGRSDRWSSCAFVLQSPGGVDAIALSPDGSLFASVSFKGTICVWDSESGNLISGPFHQGYDNSFPSEISFSPNGKHIVSAAGDKGAFIWDIETGSMQTHIQNHGEMNTRLPFLSVTYSKDGKSIISVSGDLIHLPSLAPPGRVEVWDAETGVLARTLSAGGPKSGDKFALSGTAGLFALWRNHKLGVWDLSSGTENCVFNSELDSSDYPDLRLTISPRGNLIIALPTDQQGNGNMLLLQRTATGLFNIRSIKFPCYDIPYSGSFLSSPEADFLVINFYPKNLLVTIDPVTGSLIDQFEEEAPPMCHSLSRDGKRLLVGYDGGVIRMWNYQDRRREIFARGRLAPSIQSHQMPEVVGDAVFSPCGKILAACCRDEISLWDTETGEGVNVIRTNGTKLAFSADGRYMASGKTFGPGAIDERMVRVWDVKGGQNCWKIGLTPSARTLSQLFFRPSDNQLVTSTIHSLAKEGLGWAAVVRTWNFNTELDESGAIVVFQSDTTRFRPSHQLYLSPDTLTAIILDDTNSADTKLHCRHRFSTDDQFTPHTEFDESVFGRLPSFDRVVFSPTGRLIGILSILQSQRKRLLQIWETATWKVVGGPWEFDYDPKFVMGSVTFTQSDRFVICSAGGGIRVWDVQTGDLVAGPWYGHNLAFFTDIVASPDEDKLASVVAYNPYMARIWDISDLRTDKVRKSDGDFRDGSIIQDGWVLGPDNKSLLFWVPVDQRSGLYRPRNTLLIGGTSTQIDLTNFKHGQEWEECIDKEWSRL
ncbi:hypothetical protein NP233_g6828 [Leucocoprinus birnbaumii]|uniref:Nephrocystin 3-like N-terminal domain-containing protein n=1 Tax=Leucocoprinus birnbaumii TaxID=56174 RepID=A0AAD5VRF4_9AGAR|nr:hypothetical protein NP233_g6828 [Leucocoprinus birnbaumii]